MVNLETAMRSLVLGRRWIGALLVVAVLSAGGCGGSSTPAPPPPTYAVTGTVLYQGGQPLPGGIIQFLSKRDPTLNMSSIIQPDGSFKLVTIHLNDNLQGAIEGECQVMVTLPIGATPDPRPEIILLPTPYHIGREQNHFVIQLDRPAP